jgi:hypothetical protein
MKTEGARAAEDGAAEASASPWIERRKRMRRPLYKLFASDVRLVNELARVPLSTELLVPSSDHSYEGGSR